MRYQAVGSHGLAATDMPVLLSMVASGKLMPEKLVQRHSEIVGMDHIDQNNKSIEDVLDDEVGPVLPMSCAKC